MLETTFDRFTAPPEPPRHFLEAEAVVPAPARDRLRFVRRRPWRRAAMIGGIPYIPPPPRVRTGGFVERAQSLPIALVLAAMLLPLPAALAHGETLSRYEIAQSVRDQAALLWVLCWIPSLVYLATAARRRRPIPFLPVVGVLYALYYALSPMMGAANVMFTEMHSPVAALDAATDYSLPVALALGGWVALLGGYVISVFVRPRAPRAVWRSLDAVQPSLLRRVSFAAMAVGEAWELLRRAVELPSALGGLTPLLSMLALGGMIILLVEDRRGLLGPRERVAFRLLAVLCLFIEIGGGATFRVLRFFFSIFVALWIDRARLRLWHVAAGLTVLATAVAFRGAMTEWRARVWFASTASHSSLEMSVVMAGILRHDLAEKGAARMVADGWTLIAHRSANTDLLADVVRRTPFEVPHWEGSSYLSLVGAFVPRALWPNKPVKALGQEFGHRYGYINDDDTWTSINLPFLIEFYANYGVDGVLVGMLLVGVLFGIINDLLNRTGQPIAYSAIATQLLLPLFVLECDLSQQIGGMPMQGAALLLALGVVRAIQRRAITAGSPPCRGPIWLSPPAPRTDP